MSDELDNIGGGLFFIPGATPSSKNGKRLVGRRLIASKATMEWRKNTEKLWKLHKHEFRKELIGLNKPYLIGTHFVRKSRHKFDFINPTQGTQDEMVTHEWIDDDNCDEMIPFPLNIDENWYSYNKETPGAYIKIIKDPKEIELLTKILRIG